MDVFAPPYDIITPETQRACYERSPYNVVRLEYGVETPRDTPSDNRYTRAASFYRDWLGSGALKPEAAPVFYLYDEIVNQPGRRLVLRCLIAAVRLADWDEGIILPHEHTHPEAKADRLHLLEATHTQFSPLLGMYDAPSWVPTALAEITSRLPQINVFLLPGWTAADASWHRLWRLDSPDLVRALREALVDRQIIIADGHHRYETALTFRHRQRQLGAGRNAPSEYVMMALVPTDSRGLDVRPTHRLIRDLGEIDARQLLDELRAYFTVETSPIEADGPDSLSREAEAARLDAVEARRPSFVVLGLWPGEIVQLTMRPDLDLARLLPDVPPTLRVVDTVILQRLILERILGLAPDEVERGERIAYSRNPEEAVAAFLNGQAQVVFLLNATPVAQIRAASIAGARMPQKTTYFYPKPVTGTVFFDQRRAWTE